jgi:RNA polymerase sigma-70 factor (ECF subfamily)
MKTINLATDNQLVHAFQDGSNKALEVLIDRYKEKIFTSIHILVKDRYLAEDLFQDLFIKIIDTLRSKRYNEEGKFLPWAMRIGHNLCVDHFRKVNRTPAITTVDARDIFDVINVVADNADKAIIREQDYEQIRAVLNMLPAEQREVIVLRHYAEFSFRQIAQATNCTLNTALGRMRYGLLNMRRIISEKQIAL